VQHKLDLLVSTLSGAEAAQVLKALEKVALGKSTTEDAKSLCGAAAKHIKQMNKFSQTVADLFS